VTLPVVTIRSEPGNRATVAAGEAAGLAIIGCPLSEIRPVEWRLPRGDFDGLLLGSVNALRCGGPLVDNLVDKPVYAVGEATAEAARQRGLRVARTGDRGLQDLLDGLAGEALRLLRLAGRERVPLHSPPGIAVETTIVYESMPLPVPESAGEVLRKGALVLLHSAAAARHFAAECDRLAIHRRDIRLAALSPRVAQAAGVGWAALRSAAAPNEAALLALGREMCHNSPPG
jgi:uroporphyrinogen-III synthase